MNSAKIRSFNNNWGTERAVTYFNREIVVVGDRILSLLASYFQARSKYKFVRKAPDGHSEELFLSVTPSPPSPAL